MNGTILKYDKNLGTIRTWYREFGGKQWVGHLIALKFPRIMANPGSPGGWLMRAMEADSGIEGRSGRNLKRLSHQSWRLMN